MSEGKTLIEAIGGVASALGKLFFAIDDVALAASELKNVCDAAVGDEEAEQEVEDMIIDVEVTEE